MRDRYLDLSVESLLEQVAARQPAPGGGSVAAIALALAAGLVAMAARFSDRQLPDHEELANSADSIRFEGGSLADADAHAYAQLLASRWSEKALRRATEVPLEICDRGAALVQLGVRVARDGNPNLRGDAATGLLLAEAAVRSAAQLVRLNAGAADGLDEHVQRADADVTAVSAALRAAGLLPS